MNRGLALAAGTIGVAALFLLFRDAQASGPPGPEYDGPNAPPGTPGKGPRGAPKPKAGGTTTGTPPSDASYVLPEGWDPVRGLWISPDCEVVVEAPGWYCGDDQEGNPFLYGGFSCSAIEFDSYEETMLEPGNGVAGYVDFLIGTGMQPEEIAMQILVEVSPLCADLPAFSPGLQAWYEWLLERVVASWEEYQGIPFEAGVS